MEVQFRQISLYFIHLQEIADARRIRNRILHNFELSVQSGIDEQEGKRLLHTVIVGGGPTGVEFGAELYDFVEQVSSGYICVAFVHTFMTL